MTSLSTGAIVSRIQLPFILTNPSNALIALDLLIYLLLHYYAHPLHYVHLFNECDSFCPLMLTKCFICLIKDIVLNS